VSVVIGGGFNSGILATGAVEGARYNYGPAPPETMDRVRAIETVCREYGVPLQAAAMQFVAAHPAIASLVVGARSAQQLKQSIGWFDTRIPAELWSELKSRGFLRGDAPTPSV
jgi:D-threo-aldose 1-dehydrogenase